MSRIPTWLNILLGALCGFAGFSFFGWVFGHVYNPPHRPSPILAFIIALCFIKVIRRNWVYWKGR